MRKTEPRLKKLGWIWKGQRGLLLWRGLKNMHIYEVWKNKRGAQWFYSKHLGYKGKLVRVFVEKEE